MCALETMMSCLLPGGQLPWTDQASCLQLCHPEGFAVRTVSAAAVRPNSARLVACASVTEAADTGWAVQNFSVAAAAPKVRGWVPLAMPPRLLARGGQHLISLQLVSAGLLMVHRGHMFHSTDTLGSTFLD